MPRLVSLETLDTPSVEIIQSMAAALLLGESLKIMSLLIARQFRDSVKLCDP
jgi:hypothetical protein